MTQESERTIRYGKTGYVALLGRPNTGKSTLLNTILHRHLAAVSSKPQTTRKHLLGIFTDQHAQILFLDAPGIHKGRIAIDDAMDRSINRVLDDADIIVCLVDPTRQPGEEDLLAAQRAASVAKKCIIVINKIDVATEEGIAKSLEFYRQYLPEAPVLKIAAIDENRVKPLMALLKKELPQGPFLYDEDDLTDVYERDIAAELIRETLLEKLRQEVPHGIAVVVDKWQEKDGKVSISATLHIEREAHKAIIIGRGGEMIKSIRISAAKRIGEFIQARVVLSLFVKVTPDWRNNLRFLNEVGLGGN